MVPRRAGDNLTSGATTGGVTTNFLWDEASPYGDIVLETDSAGTVQASYTLGESDLLAQTRGSTVSYVLPDGQGSVRQLANSVGEITDTYRYDAYGNALSHSGTTTLPYDYDGQRLDATSGLYQLRVRERRADRTPVLQYNAWDWASSKGRGVRVGSRSRKPLRLTLDEARGLMLAAQGLWRNPPGSATASIADPEIAAESATAASPLAAHGEWPGVRSPIPAETATSSSPWPSVASVPSVLSPRSPAETATVADIHAEIERLGAVQVDTISVVARSQYLVLWSRLGPYDPALLDALHTPHRRIFEYWSHAASIVPMSDYPYYRATMLQAAEAHLWDDLRIWMGENSTILEETRARIRKHGPLASADFERDPNAARPAAWAWYGPKESRKALDVLWTLGDLMISNRRGGQKVYDLRERVLKEAFGRLPRDTRLPTPIEQHQHFTRRTVRALGVVTPAWLWDYFRLHDYVINAASNGHRLTKRAAAEATLAELAARKKLLPIEIEGLDGSAYLDTARLPDLERLRAGARPARTTLLSPFDSLIWHRPRTQALFGYEVCFEAYVVPEKRRYGYYCLAILHQDRLVGRLDPKFERAERRLLVRAVYLEPEVRMDETLLAGLTGALRELGVFLGAETIAVERSEPAELAAALRERLS